MDNISYLFFLLVTVFITRDTNFLRAIANGKTIRIKKIMKYVLTLRRSPEPISNIVLYVINMSVRKKIHTMSCVKIIMRNFSCISFLRARMPVKAISIIFPAKYSQIAINTKRITSMINSVSIRLCRLSVSFLSRSLIQHTTTFNATLLINQFSRLITL